MLIKTNLSQLINTELKLIKNTYKMIRVKAAKKKKQ